MFVTAAPKVAVSGTVDVGMYGGTLDRGEI
jgi:hypothetical protein